MIKVSCPSCSASYDVDEKRLPDEGLRMRCPKCSESFQVYRDGSTARAGGGAGPAASQPPKRRATVVGIGPEGYGGEMPGINTDFWLSISASGPVAVMGFAITRISPASREARCAPSARARRMAPKGLARANRRL